ncbi:recombinase family protein [Candidatus Pacearchaeota archaeon]|jgi:DNA invertase Pin-like site-specific DNA recombinase|nr:recombinase family protein [Candidatus Pacearchaeota archaeon]
MQYPSKTVGYARVSTDDQTTVNQIDELRKNGVTVIFCDEGISGTKAPMERAEYRAMIKYLQEHPDTKTIVIYELSRLGRNLWKSIETFIGLEKEGYTIWSLTEEWTHASEPSMRNLMLMLVSWMNEQEQKRLSARTKLGMDRVRKYGSKSGKPIGKPKKNPDRIEVEAMRSTGLSWHKISDRLGLEISTLYRYRMQWKRADLRGE